MSSSFDAFIPDTIFALATVPGKSGVAVFRVSGPRAMDSLDALQVPRPAPRRASVAFLKAEDGAPLDHALILYFAAPHSFTGEEVVEYHTHGSRAVTAALTRVFAGLPGFRPADPGEFTRRAFFNGKMDLTAAEGLADLIDAETEGQRRQAIRLMQGEAAQFFNMLREEILSLLAWLEAYIDFADDEVPADITSEIGQGIAGLRDRIAAELKPRTAHERVRDGVRVVIIGPPNAGKSSLLNHLARRDVAIVSSEAGTTRDVIELPWDVEGVPVILTDTAGIRGQGTAESDNPTENDAEPRIGVVEREGIRRSFLRADEADILLILLDAEDARSQGAVYAPLSLLPLADPRALIAWNKTEQGTPEHTLPGAAALALSVRTGQGVAALLAALAERVRALTLGESPIITRARHRHQLASAHAHLEACLRADALPIELQCEELRRAATEIGKITGKICPDEVLGRIFSRFCIGK